MKSIFGLSAYGLLGLGFGFFLLGSATHSSSATADEALADELKGVGHRIIYETYQDGNWELFVRNADGSGVVNLTRTPKVNELYPHVSPDGTKVSFVVDGDRAAAAKVMDSFKLIALGPTFGTTRSVANHPASFTHHTMKPEEREAAGVPDGLIRLSVGLERPEDIIADLERALDQQ